MHAAVLHEYGMPTFDEFDEPAAGQGQAVVDVAAAGINPVDVRFASGTHYAGKPPLPSVAGLEGVGTIAGSSRRVYFDAPIAPFGSMAERTLVAADAPIDLPDGLDDGLAVALGIAGIAGWLPLAWRARLQPGERVLVLGATGVVGRIAVQAARILGAGRIVAAGRDPDALRAAGALGADATVTLPAPDAIAADGAAAATAELAAAFREAAGGDADVVVDPLWGMPAVAALEAMGVGGRLVQLGQSAAGEATLPSAAIRGKHLDVLGYLNFLVPADVRRDAYVRLTEHALAGRIAVDVERVPLREVADAWARQQAGVHAKLVLVP